MHGQSQRPAARLAGRPPRSFTVPILLPFKNKVLTEKTRPRQEELAGKGKTPARGACREGQRPRQEELAGKANQGACRSKAATLHPSSSASNDVSPQDYPRSTWRGAVQPCGARWQAKLTRRPSWRSVAPLTVVSLHCWGDRTGIKCPCPLPSELGRGHCWTLLYQPVFLPFYPSFYAATCR